jgi:hypothetical protein
MGRIGGDALDAEGKYSAEIDDLVDRVTARLEARD